MSTPISLKFETQDPVFGSLCEEMITWVFDNYTFKSSEVRINCSATPKTHHFQGISFPHELMVERINYYAELQFFSEESFNLFRLMFSNRYERYLTTTAWIEPEEYL